ncbi:hypothetical protein DRP04_03800 [Archaeoglobales archaeon]|nr:MAG: hypothetical protein DRP04_03800 [Archaeoglobales archaeon]
MNPKLIGDVNGDGKVDLIDRALILQSLGTTIYDIWGYGEDAFNKEADLNDDDVIDEEDLQIWEKAYTEGPTSGLRVVNKDPFMWQARTSPCLSWSGWVQTHPHEECPGEVLPDEFKWDFKWLEKPYRGCYAYCKVYYPWKAVPPMPRGVGTVVVRQGHSPRKFAETMNLRCEGGYQFKPISVFDTPQKILMKYKFNIISSGYWFGVGIDVWGSFSEEIPIYAPDGTLVCTTDFFELILYDYLTGQLGEFFPPSMWWIDKRSACGLEWVICRWNSAVLRSPNEWITCEFDLGDGLTFIATNASYNGVEAYIHGIDLILELLDAEGEVWFDRAWYLVPAKPKKGLVWLPSTAETVSILTT